MTVARRIHTLAAGATIIAFQQAIAAKQPPLAAPPNPATILNSPSQASLNYNPSIADRFKVVQTNGTELSSQGFIDNLCQQNFQSSSARFSRLII